MPVFQIHRLKEPQRQQYRWAPHVIGASIVKPKDYEKAEQVEAATVYAAWEALRRSEKPLEVGDLLEAEGGAMRICKYVGFEDASWLVPEQLPVVDASAQSSV